MRVQGIWNLWVRNFGGRPNRYEKYCIFWSSEWPNIYDWCITILHLVWAAIAKFHRLGGLNNRTLFFTFLEARSKIRHLVRPLSLAFFLLYCYVEGSERQLFLLIRHWSHHEDPVLMNFSKPNHLPNVLFPSPVTLWSTWTFLYLKHMHGGGGIREGAI